MTGITPGSILSVYSQFEHAPFIRQQVSHMQVADVIIGVGFSDWTDLGDLYMDHMSVFHESKTLLIYPSADAEEATYVYHTPHSSSVSEMCADMIDTWNGHMLFDDEIATYLLLGIIAHTHNFQNTSFSARTFDMVAKLIQSGAVHQDIVTRLYKQHSYNQIRFWGYVLEQARIYGARVLGAMIDAEDLARFGVQEDDIQ